DYCDGAASPNTPASRGGRIGKDFPVNSVGLTAVVDTKRIFAVRCYSDCASVPLGKNGTAASTGVEITGDLHIARSCSSSSECALSTIPSTCALRAGINRATCCVDLHVAAGRKIDNSTIAATCPARCKDLEAVACIPYMNLAQYTGRVSLVIDGNGAA